jgi:hypothetical protein
MSMKHKESIKIIGRQAYSNSGLSGSPTILNVPPLFPSDPSLPEKACASALLNTLYPLSRRKTPGGSVGMVAAGWTAEE